MTPTNTVAENMNKAIELLRNIEKTRLTTCPEDYPPSEWRQYKHATEDLHEILINLSELYKTI